ncbi:MAG: hypothetical protein ACRDV4_00525, partial [Acidimicrobiales bacterium]
GCTAGHRLLGGRAALGSSTSRGYRVSGGAGETDEAPCPRRQREEAAEDRQTPVTLDCSAALWRC